MEKVARKSIFNFFFSSFATDLLVWCCETQLVIICKKKISYLKPLIWQAEANFNGQYSWWLILERVIISFNLLHQKDFLKFKARKDHWTLLPLSLGALNATPILNKVTCVQWKHMFQKDSCSLLKNAVEFVFYYWDCNNNCQCGRNR